MKRLFLPVFLAVGVLALPAHYKTYTVTRSLPGRPYELGKPQPCKVDIAVTLHLIRVGDQSYHIEKKLTWDSTADAYQCREGLAISVGVPKSYNGTDSGKYMIALCSPDSTVIYRADSY